MTRSTVQVKQDRPTSSAGVGWQRMRAAFGVLSAGVGFYQITIGHGVSAAFSLCMAAVFLLSVVSERTMARTREDGVVVPASLLILVCSMGAAIGATLVLGVFVLNASL